MKKHLEEFSNININFMDRFEFVLKSLTDTKYYYDKFIQYRLKQLKEILLYYKNYLFESKKDEIIFLNRILKDNDNNYFTNNLTVILNDYNLAKKMNKRYAIINYLYKNKKKILNNKDIEEKELNKIIFDWNNAENIIKEKNEKELNKINNDDKLILINYFNNIEHKDILLNIFNQDQYEFIQNNLELLNKDNKNVDFNDNNKPNSKISTKSRSSYNEVDKLYNTISYQELAQNLKNDFEDDKNNNINWQILEEIDISDNFEKIAFIVKKILEKSIFVINIVNINQKFIHKFKDILYDIDEKTISYERFIKPMDKGKDQKFDNKEINEIFNNYKLLINFLEEIIEKFKGFFKFYISIILAFNESKTKNNNYIKNIVCEYILLEPSINEINNNQYKDENILLNKKKDNFNSFLEIIMNNADAFSNISSVTKRTNNNFSNPNFFKMDENNEYSIINLREIIAEHNKGVELIKELNNGFLASINKGDELFLYDDNFQKKKKYS